MAAAVALRNNSARKRLVQRRRLERIAHRVCAAENIRDAVEISVLLCDDKTIAGLNRKYCRKNEATDVLSFEQERFAGGGPGGRLLGDIVISIETAERNCGGDRPLIRREIDMLFCHGLLHLLGYDHRTRAERAVMQRKQGAYLYTHEAAAWNFGPKRPRIEAARAQARRDSSH